MATKRNAGPNSHGGWYKLPPFVCGYSVPPIREKGHAMSDAERTTTALAQPSSERVTIDGLQLHYLNWGNSLAVR